MEGSATVSVSSPPPPPGREATRALLRLHLIKEEVRPSLAEIIQFHALWRSYPSLSFWGCYSLGFRLNSIFWFSTSDGQERLASDWLVFHYQLPPAEEPPVLEPLSVDSAAQNRYHRGVTTPLRPKTVASFLLTPHGI